MIPDDKQLEIEIDRELKKLPELQAPSSLAPRVMAIIAARQTVPWHRHSWSTWPGVVRWSALAALLMVFGGLCYAGWGVSNATASNMQNLSGHFTGLAAVWTLINDVMASGMATISSLGTGTIAGVCAALALSYAMCLALGAACFRLAYSTPKFLRL